MKKLFIPLSLMALTMATGCSMTKNNNADITKELSTNISELIETTKKVKNIDETKLMIDDLGSQTDTNKDYQTNNQVKNSYKARVIRKLTQNNQTQTENYNKQKVFRNTNNNYYSGPLYTRFRGKTIANQQKTNQNLTSDSSKNINSNTTATNKNVYTNDSNKATPQAQNTYVTDSGKISDRYYTSRYTPRFSSNEIDNNLMLTNYIEKIQDLYAICNDTCAASYDLEALKSELISTCNNCNRLLSKVKNGEVKLSSQQIKTLGEYNKTLQSCINDLNKCKDCSEDVNIINTLKGNFSNNCDSLVAKYLKVLNNLDTNGSLCNNAQCTVAEINNYISSICGENVKNYTNRYRFDDYEIDKDFLIDQNTKPQENTSNTTPTTPIQNQTNTQNKTQNTTTNGTTTQNNTTTLANPTTVKTQNYVSYPVKNIQQQNSQNNGQNTAQPVVNTQTQVDTQKGSTVQNSGSQNQNNQVSVAPKDHSTYPMQNPNNPNRFAGQPSQNTTSNSSQNNQFDTPNRHPLTKDIKQNPNKQTVGVNTQNRSFATQSNESAKEIITYNNRHNVVRNTSTPAPKSSLHQVTNNTNSENKTTDYRTDSKKITQTPSFTNATLFMGPQNVRANNGIMTLEEI